MARRKRLRRPRHRPDPAVVAARADYKLIDGDYVFDDTDDDEAEIREAWKLLYSRRLPEAARKNRDWPVYLDHCFARILLDNAVGQMWRTVIAAPAWKNTPLPVLQHAIDLGEAIMTGDADIWELNDRSLVMRGKPKRGRKAAVRRRYRRRP